ncbi:MAG: hypothetical protein K2X77_17780 [Candidatus Obscuribacterales bacterium]|nr:hypothetical protein [Candidatus Obscuribacterales bacterium]
MVGKTENDNEAQNDDGREFDAYREAESTANSAFQDELARDFPMNSGQHRNSSSANSEGELSKTSMHTAGSSTSPESLVSNAADKEYESKDPSFTNTSEDAPTKKSGSENLPELKLEEGLWTNREHAYGGSGIRPPEFDPPPRDDPKPNPFDESTAPHSSYPNPFKKEHEREVPRFTNTSEEMQKSKPGSEENPKIPSGELWRNKIRPYEGRDGEVEREIQGEPPPDNPKPKALAEMSTDPKDQEPVDLEDAVPERPADRATERPLPTGDTIEKRSDGTQILRTPNGDKITVNPDGSHSVEGNVKEMHQKGDFTQLTFADGAKVTIDKKGILTIERGDEAVHFSRMSDRIRRPEPRPKG